MNGKQFTKGKKVKKEENQEEIIHIGGPSTTSLLGLKTSNNIIQY